MDLRGRRVQTPRLRRRPAGARPRPRRAPGGGRGPGRVGDRRARAARAGRAVRAAPRDPARRSPVLATCEAWVERLDPNTLAVRASTPRLPGGPYWPGGIAAHRNGSLHMVFGCWAHRLSPELEVLASHRLPVERPYNSFVVLDGGELVMKDCDAPRGLEPSTVSVLDPDTLAPLAAPLRLSEPSIARLSSDGESVIALGAEHRLPPAPGSRRGAAAARRSLAPELRPEPRSQLRLGPGDHRAPRAVDGQRAQRDRPRDARHRLLARPRPPVVGPSRRRALDPQRRDQRPALRNRVQPARLGPPRRRGGGLRRRQRRAAGVAAGRATSSSRCGAATASPTPGT